MLGTHLSVHGLYPCSHRHFQGGFLLVTEDLNDVHGKGRTSTGPCVVLGDSRAGTAGCTELHSTAGLQGGCGAAPAQSCAVLLCSCTGAALPGERRNVPVDSHGFFSSPQNR